MNRNVFTYLICILIFISSVDECFSQSQLLEPFVKSGKELRMLFLDGEMPLAYYKIPGTGWKFNLSQ